MKKILQKIVAFRTSRFFSPTLIVFLIISLVGFLYFYFQYQQTKKIINNPQAFSKEQTKDLLNKVGKLIELPNEEPTVATITDKDKLKNQPFFKNAKNGDRVLIFTKAKKAILYRPSTNKIIEVSQINLEPPSATSSVTASPTLLPTTK